MASVCIGSAKITMIGMGSLQTVRAVQEEQCEASLSVLYLQHN